MAAHSSSPLIAALALVLVSLIVSGCGLFEREVSSIDDVLGPEATPLPEPTPTVSAPTPADAPTAAPAPTATPTPSPTPAWQPVTTSDGLTFELPSSWDVTDDQREVDAIMGNDATRAALEDLGVTELLTLFDVRIRVLADATDGDGKVIYLTIARSPFPTLNLLDGLGPPIAEANGVEIIERDLIDTALGPGLRAHTAIDDTSYPTWFWIENGSAQILIFRGESEVERHVITELQVAAAG